MRRLEAFKELAERGISYSIKRIKRKFKKRFVAFIVYGSYITGELTLNSDIDCVAIIEDEIARFNSWYCGFLLELGRWLGNKPQAKVLGKNKLPMLNVYAETLASLKRRLKQGEPLAVEIICLGELCYPFKGKPQDFLRLKIGAMSERQFMHLTFEKDVKNLLAIHARQFVKKCLLVGRRLCLLKGKKYSNKQQTAREFDRLFPEIARHASLSRMARFLRKDLNNLRLKSLLRIISESGDFLLKAEQLSRRLPRQGGYTLEA